MELVSKVYPYSPPGTGRAGRIVLLVYRQSEYPGFKCRSDATGRIKENEANQIIALKNRLNLRKNKPFPTNGKTVSLQQEANVNSVWNNQIQEYGPQNVVDGGLQTRWASQIDCPELIIKLNERDKFNKISIFEYRDGLQNRIQAYTIDICKTTGGQPFTCLKVRWEPVK